MTDLKLAALVMRMLELRASSHEPDCRQGWPGYRDEFRLEFQPGFRDEKRPKILGTSSGAKFEKQSKMTKHKNLCFTFAPIIIASATPKAVSLQLNGMLMIWKIQQAIQDDAIRTVRIHPGNRAEVFI